MVARAYLAQFYPVHEFKSTKVTISYSDEKFVGKGKKLNQYSRKCMQVVIRNRVVSVGVKSFLTVGMLLSS